MANEMQRGSRYQSLARRRGQRKGQRRDVEEAVKNLMLDIAPVTGEIRSAQDFVDLMKNPPMPSVEGGRVIYPDTQGYAANTMLSLGGAIPLVGGMAKIGKKAAKNLVQVGKNAMRDVTGQTWYHGTTRGPYDGSDFEFEDITWFSENPKAASNWAGRESGTRVIPVRTDVKNTYDFEVDPLNILERHRLTFPGEVGWGGEEAGEAALKELKDAGYDSYSYVEWSGPSPAEAKPELNIAVFDPQKNTVSAIGRIDTSQQSLALPNPETMQQRNAVLRQEKWGALEKSAERAGIKRNQSGQYVGAPPGVDSPQKLGGLVRQYADRVRRALEADIKPGYFYEQGRNALKAYADDPSSVARLYGPTSTQVGPFENTNYAARALDQKAMGVPADVTLYPNAMRREVESVMAGDQPWQGYKKERYTNLLDPHKSQSNELANMPPNDQWEGAAMGFKTAQGKNRPPSGPAQVAFTDFVRERAMYTLNRERVAAGKMPINREQMQELHWAVIRAEAEGRPLAVTERDTVQGGLGAHIMQHSWEAQPGPTAGMDLGPLSKQEYAEEVANTMLDPAGKDRMVRAGGAELQAPVVRGTGVYKGETSPGFQSRSVVGQTQTHGLDPASTKRVDATEAVRQYALGQEARAYHSLLPAKSRNQVDTVEFTTGRVPNEQETVALQQVLDDAMMNVRGGNFMMHLDEPQAGLVFTEDGYRVLNLGMENPRFAKLMEELKPQLDEIMPGEMRMARREGGYSEYDWEGGNATNQMLEAIEDPNYPGAAAAADSPETRQLMGEVGEMYQRLQAAGFKGNQKLINALAAWKEGGLPAVRRLVERGLAPAGVIAVFAGQQASPDAAAE